MKHSIKSNLRSKQNVYIKRNRAVRKSHCQSKKVRPRVEFDCFGRYRVSGSKGYYTVICRKDERGYKTVEIKKRVSEIMSEARI
ncbi:MAG: hypothetical protein LH614_19085 [Pyrinomonadaceae bacterium]|nr:hypothetical protein [Pyrinomonadaceae bacterium]